MHDCPRRWNKTWIRKSLSARWALKGEFLVLFPYFPKYRGFLGFNEAGIFDSDLKARRGVLKSCDGVM
jgi:hypothetical protein